MNIIKNIVIQDQQICSLAPESMSQNEGLLVEEVTEADIPAEGSEVEILVDAMWFEVA